MVSLRRTAYAVGYRSFVGFRQLVDLGFREIPYDRFMMILVLSFLTLFALAPSESAHTHASTRAERETVLKACAAEFGPAIDGQNNLFKVSRYYVLEAKFDNSGRLTQLGVLLKHWFADEHPEWDKTYDVGVLTLAEYKALLRRLERIRPKGPLMQRAKWPVVTGTIATRRDTYSSAVLATSDVVPSDVVYPNRPRPRAIKYFVVYFTTTK